MIQRILEHCISEPYTIYPVYINNRVSEKSKNTVYVTEKFKIAFGEHSPVIGKKLRDPWSRKDYGTIWIPGGEIPLEMIHEFGLKFDRLYTMKVYFRNGVTRMNCVYRDVKNRLKIEPRTFFVDMQFAKAEQLDYFIAKYLETPE